MGRLRANLGSTHLAQIAAQKPRIFIHYYIMVKTVVKTEV